MATTGSERGLTLRSPGRFLAAADRLVDLYRERRGDAPTRALRDAVVRGLDRRRGVPAATRCATVTRIDRRRARSAPSRASTRCSGPSSTCACTRPRSRCSALRELDGERRARRRRRWMKGYQFALSGPIYAGTNEIQRNIIAERVLGLPAEVGGRCASRSPTTSSLFRDAVRDLLAKRVPARRWCARAWDDDDRPRAPALWPQLAEMGVLGAARARGARRPRARRARPRAAARGGRPRRAARAARRDRRGGRAAARRDRRADAAERWLPAIAAGEAVVDGRLGGDAARRRRARRPTCSCSSATASCTRSPARRVALDAAAVGRRRPPARAASTGRRRARRRARRRRRARPRSTRRSTAARSATAAQLRRPRRPHARDDRRVRRRSASSSACRSAASRRSSTTSPTPASRSSSPGPLVLPRRLLARRTATPTRALHVSMAKACAVRRRRARRPHGAAVPRRHRLHVRVRPAPVDEARLGARRGLGRRAPGTASRVVADARSCDRDRHSTYGRSHHARGLHRRRRPHAGRASAAAASARCTPPTSARTCSRRWSSAPASTRRRSRTSSSAASTPSARRPATSPAPAGSPPGCPSEVPGTTIDRQCGSSQQAVHFAAQARDERHAATWSSPAACRT